MVVLVFYDVSGVLVMQLTDEQLNKWCAKRIMGWKLHKSGFVWVDSRQLLSFCTKALNEQRAKIGQPKAYMQEWNPTNDHNHAQMVLEKLGHDLLTKKYHDKWAAYVESKNWGGDIQAFNLFAPSRQKMEAVHEVLEKAVKSKYSKPVCRGSLVLGSACGKCEKCQEEQGVLRGDW